MQIPEELSKCVAFLSCKRNSGMHFMGTAFFVAYPISDIDGSAGYVVTAKHVIEEIQKRATDGNAYLRVNKMAGGADFVECPISDWQFAVDGRIDVAAAPIGFQFSGLDHKMVSTTIFLTDAEIAQMQVGPGDDLFFPGLVSKQPGDQSNVPIMRTGTIAAMPKERVKTKWGNISAYLAEARSIGGLSGSPVFFHSGTRILNGQFSMDLHFRLLGLVHGHYGVKDEYDATEDNLLASDTTTRSINMGIAIVVPVADILTVLESPKFVSLRDQTRQEHLANSATTA
jgi:hypothetical protein